MKISKKLIQNLLMVAAAVMILLPACSLSVPKLPASSGVQLVKSEKKLATPDSQAQTDLQDLSAANTAFAVKLYQQLRQADGNLFFSPYSISQALAMAQTGASGQTAEQMARTLQFTMPTDRVNAAFNLLTQELASRQKVPNDANASGFKLNIVNALWGQKSYSFEPTFLDSLAAYYGAGLRLLNFEQDPEPSRQTINTWVSDQTQKKIQDLIPAGAIDANTRLVLTNAIYFKAGWMNQFDKNGTKPGDFTLLDGKKIQVSMMAQSHELQYAAGSDYQAVALPYVGGQVDMVIVLPAEGQFASFEQGLDSAKLNEILNGLSVAQVNLSMPKFRYDSSFSLNAALKLMGMPDAFDSQKADFSGMTGKRELYISDAVHKAYISVDEQGTEAAAATAIMMGITAMPAESADMKIDRPFLFLIRDQQTSAILFLGRVMNPGS
jgi:serpin B